MAAISFLKDNRSLLCVFMFLLVQHGQSIQFFPLPQRDCLKPLSIVTYVCGSRFASTGQAFSVCVPHTEGKDSSRTLKSPRLTWISAKTQTTGQTARCHFSSSKAPPPSCSAASGCGCSCRFCLSAASSLFCEYTHIYSHLHLMQTF